MLANLSAVSDTPRATLPLLINAANQHSFKLIFEIHVFVNRTLAWFTKSRKTIDTRSILYLLDYQMGFPIFYIWPGSNSSND
jgi:hypothetical protein